MCSGTLRSFVLSLSKDEPEPGSLSLSKDERQPDARELVMSFWVYILRCADGSYYVGHTDNLDARVSAHLAGEVEGYTRTRRPVYLVFSAEFPTREDALTWERQIKGWSRAKKEALMKGNWTRIQALSRLGKG